MTFDDLVKEKGFVEACSLMKDQLPIHFWATLDFVKCKDAINLFITWPPPKHEDVRLVKIKERMLDLINSFSTDQCYANYVNPNPANYTEYDWKGWIQIGTRIQKRMIDIISSSKLTFEEYYNLYHTEHAWKFGEGNTEESILLIEKLNASATEYAHWNKLAELKPRGIAEGDNDPYWTKRDESFIKAMFHARDMAKNAIVKNIYI